MLRIDSRNVWIFSAIERLKETTVEMQQITQSLQNLQLEVQIVPSTENIYAHFT